MLKLCEGLIVNLKQLKGELVTGRYIWTNYLEFIAERQKLEVIFVREKDQYPELRGQMTQLQNTT